MAHYLNKCPQKHNLIMKNDEDDFKKVVHETEKFFSDEDEHMYVDDPDNTVPLQIVRCILTTKKDEDD